MILANERLEAIAQMLAHEPTAHWHIDEYDCVVMFFGADMWFMWELTPMGMIEVMERTLELMAA